MLKTDPKYGVFSRWPEDGDDWLHPDDIATARTMIPSQRVFRRDGNEDGYDLLHYGKVRLRIRRSLWLEVRPEGFDIGDWVEVKSSGQQQTPRTGVIREMLFNHHSKRIEYQVEERDMPIETHFHAEDLRPVALTEPNEWSSEIRRG